jgi:hypothetical protein
MAVSYTVKVFVVLVIDLIKNFPDTSGIKNWSHVGGVGATAFSITTFSILTFRKIDYKGLSLLLSFIILRCVIWLNVILLCAKMLKVILLSVNLVCVILLSACILNIYLPRALMFNVIIQKVILLSFVVRMNVISQNVLVPWNKKGFEFTQRSN